MGTDRWQLPHHQVDRFEATTVWATGSIDAMKEQANELGLVLGDELIDNGVVLTDTLDQTKRAFQSIITQLGGSLMPILTKVLSFNHGVG